MAVESNVRARRYTGTGACGVGRARISQIIGTSSGGGSGRLTITNGLGGSTLLDVDLPQGNTFQFLIPDTGILSDNDPYISTATNVTSVTIMFR